MGRLEIGNGKWETGNGKRGTGNLAGGFGVGGLESYAFTSAFSIYWGYKDTDRDEGEK